MIKKRLNLILGVHRSGTSLITHGLIAAGAQAGNFTDIKDDDNPEGYAEHSEVRRFNEELLAHLGVSWDNWGFRASLVDFDTAAFNPWRENAIGILRNSFQGAGPFVLKDPRCATLAPFWERVIPQAGFELRRILIIRNPAEVAESQRQRALRRPHAFRVIAEAEPMAALWAVTMTELLTVLSDDATLLIEHSGLLADPAHTLAAAASFAGLTPSPEVLEDFAAKRVKHSLYRAKADTAPTSPGPWMAMAQKLYSDLVSSGTPRILGMEEAQRIAHNQTQLTLLLSGLIAVRQSLSRALSNQNIQNIETEARLYIAEQVGGQITPFGESRGAATLYELSGARTSLTLTLPPDVQPMARLRLDPACAPAAIVLHRLALCDATGNEVWRWQGDRSTFTHMLGAVLRPTAAGPCLVCYDNDPQFELNLPQAVLTKLGPGASLIVEMTPRPLLDALPEVLAQDQAAALLPAERPAFLPVVPAITREFVEVAQLMKAELERRNATIAGQRSELASLHARQKALEAHVQRAEAQLEVLKEFVLAAFGKAVERI